MPPRLSAYSQDGRARAMVRRTGGPSIFSWAVLGAADPGSRAWWKPWASAWHDR